MDSQNKVLNAKTACHSQPLPQPFNTHSLSLSLSLTHTHTHTLSLSLSHTFSLSLSHTHTHTHSLSLSHTQIMPLKKALGSAAKPEGTSPGGTTESTGTMEFLKDEKEDASDAETHGERDTDEQRGL